MSKGVFWLLGGPNGAGKTTLVSHARFQRLLAGVRFLNPDELTLRKLRAAGYTGFQDAPQKALDESFITAARDVEEQLRTGLAQGEVVGVESVLSTRKYCPLIEDTLARGGFFGFIYVALQSADLSRERVAIRVAQGGHDVPAEKLAQRWRKSAENVGWFAKRANRFWVVDNSDSTPGVPPRLIALGGGGSLELLERDAIPEIVVSLVSAFGLVTS